MKKVCTLLLASLCYYFSFAQSTKTATAANQAGGNDNWTSASTITSASQTSDDVYLHSPIGSNKSSRVLSLTGFGFALPAGASISGIVVSVERHAGTTNKTNDQVVQLIVGGVQVGDNKAAAGFWPTS